MADPDFLNEHTTEAIPPSGEDAVSSSANKGGLRSGRGIRWLLLAGALVSAVSLYRLVESQWELMPVTAQYLVLVFSALGLYWTGELTHRRLRLPLAGSALLLLFTALVPVLSWGAVYLHLLAEPMGWVAFVLGNIVLLVAARRPLHLMFEYRGFLYPAILAVFMVAQAVLPEFVGRRPELATTIYLGAAFLLGALLLVGSRHINRFFFHRDRRDGLDRPIQWIPFVVLGVLYLGAMTLLDPRSEFIAFPLAIIGMVLVDTGEEYYGALIRSRGEKPERWPKRSLALMTIGVAAIVVAFPLSFRDPTLQCSALVSLCAAIFMGRWSLRSPGFGTHLAALGSVFAAYHLFPALVPELAKRLWARLLAALDLSHGSPLAISIADLGFLLILVAWSGLLRRTGASAALRSVHAGITVIYLWWLGALTVADPTDPWPFLAVLSAVALVALVISRRPELVVGLYGTLAALVMAVARNVLVEKHLLSSADVLVLGAAVLATTLIVGWIERPLGRMLAIESVVARWFVLVPGVVVAFLIASHGVFGSLYMRIGSIGWIELMIAGGVLVAAGLRLGNRPLPAIGSLFATIGLHFLVFDLTHAVAPLLVVTTQALVVISLWAVGDTARRTGPIATLLRPTAFILALFHFSLALWWLLLGIAEWNLTVEPVILVALAILAVDVGLTTRTRGNVINGGLLLTAFAQLQFLAMAGIDDWSVAMPASVTAVGLALVLMIILAAGTARGWIGRRFGLDQAGTDRLLAASVRQLVDLWTAVSVIACLLFCGPAGLVLSVAMVVVVLLSRLRLQGRRGLRDALSPRLLLVLLLQGVVFLLGTSQAMMLPVLVSLGFGLLPAMAAAVLGWRLLVHLMDRQSTLAGWSLAVEFGLILFIAAAAVADPELPVVSHLAVVAVAIGLAALRVSSGTADARVLHSWMAQIWIGLAILHGFTAGWLHFDGAVAPWVLLLVAIAEIALAGAIARTSLGPVFGPTCRVIGNGLPMVAWLVAMLRVVLQDGPSVWVAALPAFSVSLLYAIIALREGRSTGSSLAASITFGWTLLAVVVQSGLGFEFSFLAPGLSLMALATLLRPRVGPTWSSYLATAGAACLYATPIVALSEQVSWMWLAILLVMAVAIGSACIALQSRSLLVVSTAAMLTDLGFFVFKIGTTEPLLLWVFGLAFGLTLMAWAGYLEYQREGLLQQVRIFGRELKSWN